MNTYTIYAVIGLVWGTYAARQQVKVHLSTTADVRLYLCGLINAVLWPIGMLVAWNRYARDRIR